VRKYPLPLPQVDVNQVRGGVFWLALGAGGSAPAGEDAARRGAGDDVEQFGDGLARQLLDFSQDHPGNDPANAAAVDGKDPGHCSSVSFGERLERAG